MKKLLLLLSVLFSVNAIAQVSVLSQTNPSCPGMCNGAVTLSITGGTMPYTVNTFGGPSGCTITPISNLNSNTVTISGLCSCLYNFVVVDAMFSPVGGVPVAIVEPAPINITFSVQNVCCNGACNGAISAFVFGGTAPYSYNWSVAGTGSMVTNLCAGNYFLVVTDNNGCVKTASTTVTAPPAFSVSASSAATSCSSCCDGSVNATASGGNPGYTYTIYPGATTNTTGAFTNLCAGVYSVCASDAGCCTTCTGVSVVNGTTTSISTQNGSNNAITVYPNPSAGNIEIRMAANLNGASYEIFDVLGKRTDSGKMEEVTKIKIQQEGVYFIVIRNSENAVISRKKVIIEK
jgi:hypothetical protein